MSKTLASASPAKSKAKICQVIQNQGNRWAWQLDFKQLGEARGVVQILGTIPEHTKTTVICV